MRILLPRLLRSLASACTLVLLLSGCQSSGTDGLIGSDAPAEISGPAASAIAGDMVSRLAEQIGQGKAKGYGFKHQIGHESDTRSGIA